MHVPTLHIFEERWYVKRETCFIIHSTSPGYLPIQQHGKPPILSAFVLRPARQFPKTALRSKELSSSDICYNNSVRKMVQERKVVR